MSFQSSESDLHPALLPLQQHRLLRIRQIKEWGEILTGWETRNRYQVMADDQPLYFVGEVDTGLGAWLKRVFLKAMRPFTLEVRAANGELALRIRRPFRWLFSRAEVESPLGAPMGAVQWRFAWFTRRYDILSPSGELLAELRGPFFKPWTFLIESAGAEIGAIRKRWSGFGKELFTVADDFGLEVYGPVSRPNLRELLLAATFLIDFVHFEKRN